MPSLCDEMNGCVKEKYALNKISNFYGENLTQQLLAESNVKQITTEQSF